MFIADATAMQMGTWIIVLFSISTGILTILRIIDYFKPKPPLHNQFADKVDTEKRFIALEKNTEKRFDDLEIKIGAVSKEQVRLFENIQNRSEERTGKIHKRIDDILQAVSEMRGELRAHGGGK